MSQEADPEGGDIPSQEDQSELDAFLEEYNQRCKRKYDTLEKNITAAQRRPTAADLLKLDSSLKKNSAFVKKLRSFTGRPMIC